MVDIAGKGVFEGHLPLFSPIFLIDEDRVTKAWLLFTLESIDSF